MSHPDFEIVLPEDEIMNPVTFCKIKFTNGYILDATLYVTITNKAGWLCGTQALTDFNVTIGAANSGPFLTDPDVPAYFKTNVHFVSQEMIDRDYWRIGAKPGYHVAWDMHEAQKELYKMRTKIFDKLFEYLLTKLAAHTLAVIMGGRVTSFHNDEGRESSIRTPELVEYIIHNRLGVISGTHIHNNINYQEGSGAKILSGQQYWLWTYQRKAPNKRAEDHQPLPQVILADPDYCRVFPGEWDSTEDLRQYFLRRWSRSLDKDKNDILFTPRYNPKKPQDEGTIPVLNCQKTIEEVKEIAEAAAVPAPQAGLLAADAVAAPPELPDIFAEVQIPKKIRVR